MVTVIVFADADNVVRKAALKRLANTEAGAMAVVVSGIFTPLTDQSTNLKPAFGVALSVTLVPKGKLLVVVAFPFTILMTEPLELEMESI